MVRETSVRAYREIKSTLGERQEKVLGVILTEGPICNYDIAKSLGVAINTVTPRTSELVLAKCVEQAYKAKCLETNRTVIYWKARLMK